MPHPFAEFPHARHLPTEEDLRQLSRGIRSAAEERELTAQTAAQYEEWIFLFQSWCLTVPPFRICRDRIGGFWSALQDREVGRWKVCQAMDALGFFFGAVLGQKSLSFPRQAPLSSSPALSDAAVNEVYSPLPLGSLPSGAAPWTVVPTRSSSSTTSTHGAAAAPASSEERPTFWDLLEPDAGEATDVSASDREETATLTIPRALADQLKALARQRGLSPEALAREVLESACTNTTTQRESREANGLSRPLRETESVN